MDLAQTYLHDINFVHLTIFGSDNVPIRNRRRLRCPFVGYDMRPQEFHCSITYCEGRTMCQREQWYLPVSKPWNQKQNWWNTPSCRRDDAEFQPWVAFTTWILEHFLEFRNIGWEGFDFTSNTRAVSRCKCKCNCQYLSASPPLVTSNTRPSRNACACRFIKQEKSQRALAEALLSDSHAACSLRQALCLEDGRLAKTVALLCDAQWVMPQSQSILVWFWGWGLWWMEASNTTLDHTMKKCPVQFLWLRWSS